MKEYTQSTLRQSYEMSEVHRVGQDPTQFARITGVRRKTIPRELKRNINLNGYYLQAGHRRSPEQIAGWPGRNDIFQHAKS